MVALADVRGDARGQAILPGRLDDGPAARIVARLGDATLGFTPLQSDGDGDGLGVDIQADIFDDLGCG